MSWQILLTSAAVGLTTLLSICCPMENTPGSPAALAVPGKLLSSLGLRKVLSGKFSNLSVSYMSCKCHTHPLAAHFALPSLLHLHCSLISLPTLPLSIQTVLCHPCLDQMLMLPKHYKLLLKSSFICKPC